MPVSRLVLTLAASGISSRLQDGIGLPESTLTCIDLRKGRPFNHGVGLQHTSHCVPEVLSFALHSYNALNNSGIIVRRILGDLKWGDSCTASVADVSFLYQGTGSHERLGMIC